MSGAPLVTLGMPVYNGEAFVEQALRSLLAQTFGDFELLISDNASTDRTAEICRDYAAREPRIVFTRNPANLGFARNQNGVYERARGKYFLLTHHDDLRAPEYLARTVPVLEADASVVACFTDTCDIDERGNPLPRKDPYLRVESADLRERFHDIIRMDHICEPGFGLTRVDVLRTTHLHGAYADSDRVLLAELVLHGRFARIRETLFFRRAHAAQSTEIARSRQSRTVWFNPSEQGRLIFPHFRQYHEYRAAIARAPLSRSERSWCRREMLRWAMTNRRRLLSDVEFAARQLLRPLKHALLPGSA